MFLECAYCKTDDPQMWTVKKCLFALLFSFDWYSSDTDRTPSDWTMGHFQKALYVQLQTPNGRFFILLFCWESDVSSLSQKEQQYILFHIA